MSDIRLYKPKNRPYYVPKAVSIYSTITQCVHCGEVISDRYAIYDRHVSDCPVLQHRKLEENK